MPILRCGIPWDFAAGAILIEETGGKTSNLFGEELDYINGGSFFGATIQDCMRLF